MTDPTTPKTTTAVEDTTPPNSAGATFNDPFPTRDRRQSDEWDASKVPPSRFQKRKGSIYSTPGSRDGHVDRNYAAKFHETHAEKGYGGGGSSSNNSKKS